MSAGVPKVRLDFGDDWLNRRTSKTGLSDWNGSADAITNTTGFLDDGWNLIAELKPGHTLIRAYAWGLDLGGALETQGNVGGLVELVNQLNNGSWRGWQLNRGA